MITNANLNKGFKQKFKPAILIISIACVGLSGCAGSHKDTDPRYTHSINQQKELDHWGQKYQANRQNSENAIGFAKALVKVRQEGRALDVMQKAHAENPNDKNLTSEYGRIALNAGENGLASKLLKKASTNQKADWKILSAKGVLEARAGKNKTAINYFKKALKQNPRQASILNNLGLAYAVTGNYKSAEKYLKQALWDSRYTRQVRQNLAMVYAMQGKVKEAETIALEPLPKKYAASNKKITTEFETKVERAR